MGPLTGCAQSGRYIALMLFAGLVMAFAFLSSGGFSGWFGPRTQPGGISVGGAHGPIPAITRRFFGSGTASANVTGDLTLTVAGRPLDDEKSYSDGVLTWIAYGKTNPTILISFGEGENSVAVSDGHQTALGVDSQCVFDVTVTADLVTGKVTCEHAQLIENGVRVGTTRIEISKFEAATKH